jgi:hypothetical protein
MNCEAAAEFLSSLCDGERIPRDAAVHLGSCKDCQAQLNDYVHISIELKRMAMATEPASVREVSWGPQEGAKSGLWRMWRGSMRIPKYAFGAMLLAITSLVAGIALTRAQTRELWFQFEVSDRRGATAEMALMSAEPKGKVPNPGPVIVQDEAAGTLGFIVRVLDARNGSEKLGVRALWIPPNSDLTDVMGRIQSSVETEYWMIPGQKLSVPVKDYGQIEITGRLLDKLPDEDNPQEMKLYPKQGEFRLTSPQLLLVDGRVVSKGGGDGLGPLKDEYFAYYAPHDGHYIFAFTEFPGATEGSIHGNQIDFTLEGRTYNLIASTPIVGPDVTKIWIRHHVGSRLVENQPIFPDQDAHSSMMFGDLKHLLEHMTQE